MFSDRKSKTAVACAFGSLAFAACAAIRGASELPDGGADGGAVDVNATLDRGTTGDTSGAPASVSDAALGETACAAESQQAERLPLDLYLMIDSSGSMADKTADGDTKWAAVSAALTSFIGAPQSAGLGVGLQYFPIIHPGVPAACTQPGDCGSHGPCRTTSTCSNATSVTDCNTNADCAGGATCIPVGRCLVGGLACAPVGGTCSATAGDVCAAVSAFCAGRDSCESVAYATPAVEVAPLPGAAAALVASLGGHAPDGNTPTASALSGAIAHAQSLARSNPSHRVVAVLATDGLPTECMPTDVAGVAMLARAGLAGTPSVATYVIGVFSPEEAAGAQANLDALANAGGTGTAFVINTGQNVTQSFIEALNAVRTRAVGCSFAVPAAKAGAGQLDYNRVNVSFTDGGAQISTIGYVPDRMSCDPVKGGWYYDVNPASGARPQTINVCETTCRQFQADPTGRVDILLGCTTVVVIP